MADRGAAGQASTPGLSEPASLLRAVERLLAVPAEERHLRRLVSALADAVPEADSAALLLPEEGRLAVAAGVGLDGAEPVPAEGWWARLADPGKPPTTTDHPGPPLPRGTRRAAAAAVRGGGVLILGSRGEGAPGEGALLLLRMAADRAGLALDRARLERERDAAAGEIASRRNAVDYVIGVVGHDLRNPLGAIHMSAALLQRRGGLEGWQARAVERLRSSSGRMSRIIADLLSYTRTRLGGGLPIERRPAHLGEIVRRAVDELAAANPGRRIPVSATGDLSGEWDPDRLEQVVSNLVSNALDHGAPEAPVEVQLDGEGDACVLRVRNRGPMPPEVLSHLFEPFSRPPDERSRKASGLGLGLYISREIVQGHGGEIAASSAAAEDDGETVITVRLPR